MATVLAVRGVRAIDAALADLPDLLVIEPSYEQRVGYKSWKVLRIGRAINWLQWNDGRIPLRISFPNLDGIPKVWKFFARFDEGPVSGLWDQPIPYERGMAQWMPAGSDVWGCSYEELGQRITRLPELRIALMRDLSLSHQYAANRYGA